MDESNKLFSDEEAKRLGIKTSAEESEPEEGQENETVAEPNAEEGQEQEGTQAPQAETQEPVEEGSTAEPGTKAEESQEPEEKTQFDLNAFNKFIGKEFEKEDEIKELFDKADKYSDYDEKVTKLSEYENSLKERDEKITQLQESLNPLSYFTSEASYRAEMIKKQHPDKDPNLVNKVVTSDLSKVDDFDVLVDKLLMDEPGLNGDRTRAANLLRSDYNIDPEDTPGEWDSVVKDRIMVKANAARREFKELADKVEIPDVVKPEDREAQKQQHLQELKESWSKPLDRIAQYEKETITDDDGNALFDFTVPDDFKSTVKDYAEAMVSSGELPANEDTLNFVEGQVRKEMIVSNLPKILKVYKSDLESQWQEQKDKEEGNATPPNKNTAPDGASEEGKIPGISDMLRDLGGQRETIG